MVGRADNNILWNSCLYNIFRYYHYDVTTQEEAPGFHVIQIEYSITITALASQSRYYIERLSY
jgi:hypothetical protein